MKNLFEAYFRSWRHQAAMQVATLSVLIGAYTIVAMTLLIHQNLQHVLTRWGTDVKVNVYLNDSADADEISKVQKEMSNSALFAKIDFISKDQALVHFQKRMGSLAPTLINDKSFENPLPASFEAVLSKAQAKIGLDRLPDLASQISGMKAVEDVSYGQGWIENYASALNVFEISSWLLIFILVAGCLLVIGNSIKSSVMQRRDEIEVMELFGAPERMIMMPFLIEGAITGFIASIGAVVFAYVVYTWQSGVLVEGLGFWGLKDLLSFLSPWTCVLMMIGGSLLGAVGSFFCVRQVNTGWAAAEK